MFGQCLEDLASSIAQAAESLVVQSPTLANASPAERLRRHHASPPSSTAELAELAAGDSATSWARTPGPADRGVERRRESTGGGNGGGGGGSSNGEGSNSGGGGGGQLESAAVHRSVAAAAAARSDSGGRSSPERSRVIRSKGDVLANAAAAAAVSPAFLSSTLHSRRCRCRTVLARPHAAGARGSRSRQPTSRWKISWLTCGLSTAPG